MEDNAPTTEEVLREFEVVKTNKLRDSVGKYRKEGETALLNRAHAAVYQDLGFIQMPVDAVFERGQDTAKAAEVNANMAKQLAAQSEEMEALKKRLKEAEAVTKPEEGATDEKANTPAGNTSADSGAGKSDTGKTGTATKANTGSGQK